MLSHNSNNTSESSTTRRPAVQAHQGAGSHHINADDPQGAQSTDIATRVEEVGVSGLPTLNVINSIYPSIEASEVVGNLGFWKHDTHLLFTL
ncbi:hypothetical protein MJO29_003422 [Puccinia striiformis f. sp. tritici]|nr:hypothetical protein MJO29_003422 [Puccinia striiformis f. sp. tritici]